MGNFCISDEGINGFAARKQKKNHPKGLKRNHFCPRARRARGQKWLLLRPAGWFFFCLSAAKPFMPKSLMQKLHLYILFQEIIIPENGKCISRPWEKMGENAFSPKGINGILDWVGINFFADWSAKQFLPAGNNISGKTKLKISWISAVYFVFPEILFPEASRKWFYSVKLRTDYDNFCMILVLYTVRPRLRLFLGPKKTPP